MAVKIYENLPFIFLGGAFLFSFILLAASILIVFFSKDSLKKDRGRKMLIGSLYGLLIVLLVSIIFFFFIWILNRNAQKPENIGDYPVSLTSPYLPPAPETIKVSELYFNGPFLLKNNNRVNDPALFSIFCRKEGKYVMLYIGETGGGYFTYDPEYKCWTENCEYDNLYTAIFWAPLEKYDLETRQKLKLLLGKTINPVCQTTEQIE